MSRISQLQGDSHGDFCDTPYPHPSSSVPRAAEDSLPGGESLGRECYAEHGRAHENNTNWRRSRGGFVALRYVSTTDSTCQFLPILSIAAMIFGHSCFNA